MVKFHLGMALTIAAMLGKANANGDKTLADLADTLDVAFGNTGQILAAGQRYVFACYTKSGVTTENYAYQASDLDATITLTAPSGGVDSNGDTTNGYVVQSGPPTFCGTSGSFTCGTCETGAEGVYFVIDKRHTTCNFGAKTMIQGFSDLFRRGTDGPEPVAEWSNVFFNINIISGATQYDISLDNSQAGGPGEMGPNWYFPLAYGDADRCGLRLTITEGPTPPPAAGPSASPCAGIQIFSVAEKDTECADVQTQWANKACTLASVDPLCLGLNEIHSCNSCENSASGALTDTSPAPPPCTDPFPACPWKAADSAALKAQVNTCCPGHWSPWDTTDPICDDIENWDVSDVTDMNNLFWNRKNDFNRDLSAWDVSSVTNFRSMFNNAKFFNQDLSSWQIKSDADIGWMFSEGNFCQQLCGDAWVNHAGAKDQLFGYVATCANDASFPKIEACTVCPTGEKAVTTNVAGNCVTCPAGKTTARAGQTVCLDDPTAAPVGPPVKPTHPGCVVTSWSASVNDFYTDYVAPNKDNFNCIKYELLDSTHVLEAVAPDSADANGFPNDGGCPAGSYRVKIKGVSASANHAQFWFENDSGDELRNRIGSLPLRTDLGFMYKDSSNEQQYFQASIELTNKASNAFYILKHDVSWSGGSSNVWEAAAAAARAAACDDEPSCPLGPTNYGYTDIVTIQHEFDAYMEPLYDAGQVLCLTITQENGVHVLQFKSGVCANTDGEWEVKIDGFRKRKVDVPNNVIIYGTHAEYLALEAAPGCTSCIDWKKEFQHCVATMMHNYKGFTSAASTGYTTWDGEALDNPTPCKIGWRWNDGTTDKYIQYNPGYLDDYIYTTPPMVKMRNKVHDCEGPGGYNQFYCDPDLAGFWPHVSTTPETCVPSTGAAFNAAAATVFTDIADKRAAAAAPNAAPAVIVEYVAAIKAKIAATVADTNTFVKPAKTATNAERKTSAVAINNEWRAAAAEMKAAGVSADIVFEYDVEADVDPVGFTKETAAKARAGGLKLSFKPVPSNSDDTTETCSAKQILGKVVVMGIGADVDDWGILCDISDTFLFKLVQKGSDTYEAFCYESSAWVSKGDDKVFGDEIVCADSSTYRIGSVNEEKAAADCDPALVYDVAECSTLSTDYTTAGCATKFSSLAVEMTCHNWRTAYNCRGCCSQ